MMTMAQYIGPIRGETLARSAGITPDEDDDADRPVTWPGTAPGRDDPFQQPGGDMPQPAPPAEIEPGPAAP